MKNLISKIEKNKALFIIIGIFLSFSLYLVGQIIRNIQMNYLEIIMNIFIINIFWFLMYFIIKKWIGISSKFVIYELSPFIATKMIPIILVICFIVLLLLPFYSFVLLMVSNTLFWWLIYYIEMKNIE